ncbi:MAG: phage holin family protein [Terrisporobacter othiniensis]|nr:phage holin family protein [Terrisporobacter othiniensis]
MDLNFLMDYAVPVIVGICLCVGYVLKTSFPKFDNKYIPFVMAALGCVLNVWIMNGVTPEVLLAGMFSGLASTGLHQLFVTLIKGDDK